MKADITRNVRRCLFPVAGLGTRFLPATKEIPKEMLPLLDRPLIHYGVDEAAGSGCSDVVFVTGRGKRSIEDYFDRSWDLENLLVQRGKDQIREGIVAISDLAHFTYVRQAEPLGLGHAVLCGEPVCRGEYFGVILPDDVMMADPPVLGQLMEVHARLGGTVLALEEVSEEETSRYGIVDAREVEPGLFSINDLVEKPPLGEAPSRLAIMGRYVLSPKIFDRLKKVPRGAGGEYQLTDAIKSLLVDEPIWGVLYRGRRYDCGTKESWLRANVALAMNDPGLRQIVIEAVREGVK